MLSAGLNPRAFKPLSRVCFGMLQRFPFGMLSLGMLISIKLLA